MFPKYSVEFTALQFLLEQQKEASLKELRAIEKKDPRWNRLHDVHGSSALFPHTQHIDIAHTGVNFDGSHRWALQQKVPESMGCPSIIKTLMNSHFADRIVDTHPTKENNGDPRNAAMSGKAFVEFKERILKHINDNDMIGQIPSGAIYQEHAFTSSKNPETRGHSIITRIHKTGEVELVTFLNHKQGVKGKEHMIESFSDIATHDV